MADVKITVKPNGPYRVEGVVDLVDKAGNHFPKSEFGFSLCRCGQSSALMPERVRASLMSSGTVSPWSWAIPWL